MIRGGPDRAKVSQTYTLKRIDYSLRMARRLSEDPCKADIDGHARIDANDPELTLAGLLLLENSEPCSQPHARFRSKPDRGLCLKADDLKMARILFGAIQATSIREDVLNQLAVLRR